MADGIAGHWWTYTFMNHEIHLTVDAITFNERTNQVYEVREDVRDGGLARVKKTIPPDSSRGDTIVFKLDIQSAIAEAYDKAGIKQKVLDVYYYPDVSFNTTGVWRTFQCQKHTVASHEDSYKFMLDGQGRDEIHFGAQFETPSTHEGWSRSHSVLDHLLDQEHKMIAHFGDENRDRERPYLVHTMEAEGRRRFLGGKMLAPNIRPAIVVAPTELVISIPNGFDLHAFTVDPKAGHSGDGGG